MKKVVLICSLIVIQGILLLPGCHAQKNGLSQIDIPELETNMSHIASDELEGRKTGEAGLDRAAEYLAEQALRIGLKPLDDNADYLQTYTLVNSEIDQDSSFITINRKGYTPVTLTLPFYLLDPDKGEFNISGGVVFAGYGINSEIDGYNDFEGMDLQGKIVLIMNRCPLNETGDSKLHGDQDWTSRRSYLYKIPELLDREPKAVLIVMDPKSGYNSIAESSPRMARYLSKSRYVKEIESKRLNLNPGTDTKIIFIHREVASQLLRPSGRTLSELQDSIDNNLKPISFNIPDAVLDISAAFDLTEKSVPNVAGLIEGSDPELKKEVIVFLAHFDHLGMTPGGEVYNGADDNGSGTVALIELGEAFMAEKEKLKRSVLILWVSGEEIGLFGSEYYTEYPLVPLENTVACINLDMIGAVRTEKDKGMVYGEKISVHGMDSIELIGGHQSTELMEIHDSIAGKLGIITDLSLNDPDHPYRYYYRSDHFNFARNNIPVLFYSTGIHADYHKVSDDFDRINFTKLEKVSELAFLVGYDLATRTERIKIDNPYSNWGKTFR